MSEPSSGERTRIVAQQFCHFHRHDLIARQLRLGPDDMWMSHEIVAQMLMVQLATGDERLHKRTEGDAGNISLVLAELGCLCCWSPDYYARMLRIMKQGFHHAAQVSQNKAEDPDSPFRDLKGDSPSPTPGTQS